MNEHQQQSEICDCEIKHQHRTRTRTFSESAQHRLLPDVPEELHSRLLHPI